MTQRIDFGLVTCAPDERVVVRHAAIIAQPQNLARVAVGILRPVSTTATSGHEQRTVSTKRQTRGAASTRAANEEIAYFSQRVAVPAAARQCTRRSIGFDGFGVAEIDEPVL